MMQYLTEYGKHNGCHASLCTAALLKCAFIVAGIVDYPSNESLARQLERKLGSGVELTTFANVPIGSGKAKTMQGPIHRGLQHWY